MHVSDGKRVFCFPYFHVMPFANALAKICECHFLYIQESYANLWALANTSRNWPHSCRSNFPQIQHDLTCGMNVAMFGATLGSHYQCLANAEEKATWRQFGSRLSEPVEWTWWSSMSISYSGTAIQYSRREGPAAKCGQGADSRRDTESAKRSCGEMWSGCGFRKRHWIALPIAAHSDQGPSPGLLVWHSWTQAVQRKRVQTEKCSAWKPPAWALQLRWEKST